MPCNAVATVRARVAQESLLAGLAPAVVAGIVRDYLGRAYPAQAVTPLPAAEAACAFRVGPAVTVTVRGAEVSASGVTYGEETAEALLRSLPATLGELLTRAGGVLLQNRVRAALAARYGVTDEQRVADGGLVLHIEV